MIYQLTVDWCRNGRFPLLNNFRMFEEARIVINDILKIKSNETVTLATDCQRRREAEALALAVAEIGADVMIVDISDHVGKISAGDTYWSMPPKHFIATLQNSNVNIFTVDQTYAFRISHHIRSFVQISETCSTYKVDPGMGTWGLTRKDVDRIAEAGNKIMVAISDHDEVRVTSQEGTDVRLSIRGRKCLPVFPVPERGKSLFVHAVPLWAECNWAPMEDSAEGKIVIDGITEASTVLRAVNKPVEWIVKKGRVVEVLGEEDADDFRRVVATDQGAAVIGELGIGGSHKAILGTESEKGRLGTVHFGLGDNTVYPGGRNKSQVHVDGTVRRVTLQVDGKTIIEQGALVI